MVGESPEFGKEKFDLMRFLLDQSAGADEDDDEQDIELIESRRNEPTYALSDV